MCNIHSNIVGFSNLIEKSKNNNIKHFIYASSSSVYGGNKNLPFSEDQPVDHPVSLYAATKRANELMAHSYSHLYNIPSIGLRFFTVYGSWGRPDMAYYIFTKNILEPLVDGRFRLLQVRPRSRETHHHRERSAPNQPPAIG